MIPRYDGVVSQMEKIYRIWKKLGCLFWHKGLMCRCCILGARVSMLQKIQKSCFWTFLEEIVINGSNQICEKFPLQSPLQQKHSFSKLQFPRFFRSFFFFWRPPIPPPWLAWTQRVGRVQLKKLHVHGNMCKHIHTWNHRCALKTCFSHIYTLYLDSPFLVHWVDTVEWMCTMAAAHQEPQARSLLQTLMKATNEVFHDVPSYIADLRSACCGHDARKVSPRHLSFFLKKN